MNDEAQFEGLGEFPLHEAKRVTVRLDDAGIEYEVEVDDSGIKQMNPGMVVAYGGTAGLGCKLRLFVLSNKLKEARAILDSLFQV